MSMTESQQDYIEQQLQKRYGMDLEETFPHSTDLPSLLYNECYRIYNLLGGEPQDWVYEELRLDWPLNVPLQVGGYLHTMWVWRRKS